MIPFPVIVAFSTVIDVAVAGLVLVSYRRRSNRTDRGPSLLRAAHLAAAGVAGGFACLAKLPVYTLLGVDVFGLAHLVYFDGAVGVPAIGATVLVISGYLAIRSRPAVFSGPVTMLAGLAVSTVPVSIWASFVEPYRLVVERAEIPVLPARGGVATVRIGVLADLQTDRITEYERSAVERLMAMRPDVILMPGDVFQGTRSAFERELPAIRGLLGRLDAPGGVYAVVGNVDSPQALRVMFEGTGIRLLAGDVVMASAGGCTVAIGGLEFRGAAHETRETVRELGAMRGPGGTGGADPEHRGADVRILLTHAPDPVLELDGSSGIDLVVAGHTHGGQVQLPLIGPLAMVSRVPRATAAGGLTRVNDVWTYVSRGVGFERGNAPRVRLFCPPEISLLTLVPK
ncbi:MAG: metallophosphoesterase [Phycisphaerales bacterium]|nr:MAG: metallophosphoesterase [Phycisphaerales bacterium]